MAAPTPDVDVTSPDVPAPAPPVPAVVPPAPLQEPVYVAVEAGVTDMEPLTAEPVEKLFPVQEVALAEVQETAVDWPPVIDDGEAEIEHEGATAHEPYAYEPLRVPLLQVRFCETQVGIFPKRQCKRD